MPRNYNGTTCCRCSSNKSMKTPSLLGLCFSWLVKRDQLVVVLLVVCICISSYGVVYSSYMTRKLYAQLQELQAKEDEIDGEYGKLLLEQSAWNSYVRIEQVSRDKLNMVSPLTEDMVMVGK